MITRKPDDAQMKRIDDLVIEVSGLLALGTFQTSQLTINESDLTDLPLPEPPRQGGRGLSGKRRVETHAIAAGGTSAEVGGNRLQARLKLVLDHASAGNCWADGSNAVEVWESTNAHVELVIGADDQFASIVISKDEKRPDDRLDDWMYEAIALGTGELPDHHRMVGQPSSRGAIPLFITRNFRLDQPIRIALYISNAGQTAIGCLVFTHAVN